LYMAEIDASRKNTRWYQASFQITEMTWLEVVVDAATIILFALATIVAFTAISTEVVSTLPARASLDFQHITGWPR